MKRKRFLPVMVGVALSMALVSCGNSQTEAEAGAMTETSEVSASGSSSAKVNLRVWGAEEDGELLQTIVDKFVETHKGEATFNITVEPVSESDCKDKILDDVLNAPDIFTFADDQLSIMVESGFLKAVSYNVEDIKARNLAAAVNASTINDVLYSFPLTADNGYFLYYNKKYFKEDQLASLDSILEVCAANEKQFTMDWTSGWYLYSMFGNTGLTVGLNEDGISNYCTWNSVENEVKGVDVAKAMLNYAANPAMFIGGDGSLTDGAKNDTVIAGVSGVWLSTELAKAWGNNLGATKLPTYSVSGKQIQMSSYSGYKMLGVNSYSPYREWAEKLADYISNEENQMLRFEMRGQGPSNTSAASSEAVKASPAIQALIAQSEYASLQRIASHYWGPAGNFGSIIREGNPNNLDLQEVMDTMVADITAKN